MNTTIINATPLSYNLGTQDVSGTTLSPQPEDLPSHLPKVYIYAERGRLTPQLVGTDARTNIFGKNSFDPLKPYYNHATKFSDIFAKNGNSQMLQRIQPSDAPPPAAIRLMLDLLPTQVQDYQRNSDGSYKLDATTGQPIPTASKIPGFLAKWVVTPIQNGPDGSDSFGTATQGPGDQTDNTVTPAVQSTRYPIMDLRVDSFGAYGNNQAIRLWAPTTLTNPAVDQNLMVDQKAFQFYIACAERPDALTSASIVPTQKGANFVPFTFVKGLINRQTTKKTYLGDVFISAYQNISTPGLPPSFGPFGQQAIYDSQIKAVLDLVYPAEYAAHDQFSDFDGSADEEYRFNFVSGQTSNGVPYHSFQLVTGAPNSTRLSSSNNIYAQGGGDGTMSDANFAASVTLELQKYADPNHPFSTNVAMYPESHFWDSGLPIETKKAMSSLLAIRKDMVVCASTFTVGGPELTDDEENSLATTLLTHFQQYAESDIFATPTCRAIIVGQSGIPLASEYDQPLPLLYDLADKTSQFMGAGDGAWKKGKEPDENNQITSMYNVSLPFRPVNARYADWATGMIWAESFDRSSLYWPQLQTVYPDDTSVLNSYITVCAVANLERIGQQVHREVSGKSGLTPELLKSLVEEKINAKVKDKYAGRFIIVPKCTITADDSLRGYSWTTTIQIYSPTMYTVQTLIIQSNRIENAPAQQ